MRHLHPSPSPDLPFYVVVGVSELLLGLTLYSVPGSFNADLYQGITPWFPLLSAGLVAGGVLLLLQARYGLRRWLQWLLTLAAALPAGTVALHFAGHGYLSVVIIYGVPAAAMLAAPVLPSPGSGGPFRWGLMGRSIALTQLAVGILLIISPQMFTMLTGAAPRAVLAMVGSVGLAGGGLLLWYGTARHWAQPAGRAARWMGALFCVLMALLTTSALHWAGAAFWGTWAAGLLLANENRLRAFVRPAPADDSALPAGTAAWLEGLMEAWSWALALLIVTMPMLLSPQLLVSQSVAQSFVLGLSGYNILAHWICASVGSTAQRLLWHLTVLSLAIFWLLTNAGVAASSLAICAVLIPAVAAGAVGARAGLAFMGLHAVLTVTGGLYAFLVRGAQPERALGGALMYLLMLTVAEGLGVYALLYVRRLVTDLTAARQTVQDLTTQRRILEAQESVRRQVAERLHGTVQSRLIVLWHRLNQARLLLPGEPDGAGQAIREVADQLEQLRTEEVRGLSHRLHPALVRVGLAAVLGQLQDQFEGALEVDLVVSPSVEALPPPGDGAMETVCLAVHRIAEEFLANAVKHARSTGVRITADLSAQGLCVSLQDDGRGFDVAGSGPGLGLLMMQDYAQAVDGTLSLCSLPGQGTLLELRIPIPTGLAEGVNLYA